MSGSTLTKTLIAFAVGVVTTSVFVHFFTPTLSITHSNQKSRPPSNAPIDLQQLGDNTLTEQFELQSHDSQSGDKRVTSNIPNTKPRKSAMETSHHYQPSNRGSSSRTLTRDDLKTQKYDSRFISSTVAGQLFDMEDYDYQWALPQETSLLTALNPLQNLGQMQIERLECKSSTCRISVHFMSENQEELIHISQSVSQTILHEFDGVTIESMDTQHGENYFEIIALNESRNEIVPTN